MNTTELSATVTVSYQRIQLRSCTSELPTTLKVTNTVTVSYQGMQLRSNPDDYSSVDATTKSSSPIKLEYFCAGLQHVLCLLMAHLFCFADSARLVCYSPEKPVSARMSPLAQTSGAKDLGVQVSVSRANKSREHRAPSGEEFEEFRLPYPPIKLPTKYMAKEDGPSSYLATSHSLPTHSTNNEYHVFLKSHIHCYILNIRLQGTEKIGGEGSLKI